jgi:tRNA(His) 5'-end guanylyltransferase
MAASTPQSLGDRMKGYESAIDHRVIRRSPTIIRLDGRAFHTFTRRYLNDVGVDMPFSNNMHECMLTTTKWLVANVQNCVLGYKQSDEISLLLNDWETLETQQWFDGKVQKIVSISASMATAAFNVEAVNKGIIPNLEYIGNLATFDSRVFTLPFAEVCNYFVWRQQDIIRNSVQMLGHHHFSQKQLHAKTNDEVKEMLISEKGIHWENSPTWAKYGAVVYRNPDVLSSSSRVIADTAPPLFTQDRRYVERFLEVQNDNVEVKKTGRRAERALASKRVDEIHEITPADQRDGTWRKWVREADLFNIVSPPGPYT